MRTAVCSGSFDPVTLGHIDIFERASRMFDELIICVFRNIRKGPFFTTEERVKLLEESVKHIRNVRVDTFSGILPDYMHKVGASIIVRGLRSVTDYEYELKEAAVLKFLAPDIDTIFLLTEPKYSFVSSSGVREIANFHGRVTGLVPDCVEVAINRKMNQS